MATFENRSVVVSDTEGNNASVTPAGALEVDGSAVTQPVSAVSLPLPAGAATSALQTQPGVDIGDVTINNGAGAAAVNIQDGGNSITVDGPLTDAELRASAVPISAAALPLPAGAATEATLATRAAASQLPAALVGGRLDENVGAWLGSTAPTVGAKTSANSVPVVIASDQASVAVKGNSANGAAVSGNPVLMAGSDGADTYTFRTATDGTVRVDPTGTTTQPVSGTVTADQGGAPWSQNLTQVAGNAVVTQAAGELLVGVEGRAANAAAVAGNPVLSGGSDGTNARSLLTDTSGRQIAVGAAADGAAVTGNPVLIAGQDGTNAQSLLTDTSGRPNVVGAAAQGAAVAGNPVLGAGEDASGNVQRLRTAIAPPVDATPGQVVRQVVAQTATQTSVAGSAASVTLLAANANRLGATLYNDSTQNFFVKLGTTASNTSFTVRMPSQSYYEVPFGYTGRIDGIQNVANGSMRVSELT